MAGNSRRIFDDAVFGNLTDVFAYAVERFKVAALELVGRTPPGALVIPPLALSNGFTNGPDIVFFDEVEPGKFASPYYDALNGNDFVILPSDQSKADAIGYDPGEVFRGNGGNDYIIGKGLNDLIDGGRGNDRLDGNGGADILFGFTGHDQLYGGAGNDALAGGTGIDYTNGGEGDDIILNLEEDDTTGLSKSWLTADGVWISRDHVYGGGGNDAIAATDGDFVGGGDGDDAIWLVSSKESYGAVHGDNGNDTIVGSQMDDWIWTGLDLITLPTSLWTPEMELKSGGFIDKVDAGDGDDLVTTMPYCWGEVSTGDGYDEVFVVGHWDTVLTGADNDIIWLVGGAGSFDLGSGDDAFVMRRPALGNNNNASEVTLGAGADRVLFRVWEWFEDGHEQPLSVAPLILDFNLNEDVIHSFELVNKGDPSNSLNANYVKTIAIGGGSAIIYDDPNSVTADFCFARFSGVSVQDLQANITTHATFA